MSDSQHHFCLTCILGTRLACLDPNDKSLCLEFFSRPDDDIIEGRDFTNVTRCGTELSVTGSDISSAQQSGPKRMTTVCRCLMFRVAGIIFARPELNDVFGFGPDVVCQHCLPFRLDSFVQ